jgi:hypothetical protein
MHSDHGTHSLNIYKKSLLTALESVVSESGLGWLRQAIQAITESQQLSDDLAFNSAMARRKLGDDLLSEAMAIDTTFSPLDIRHWNCADAGRLVLLITAIECDPSQAEATITAYHQMGDEAERIALMRGLIFFAPGDYLTRLALEAGRTNSLELLSALTLDNPYPASFYTEPAFNQMVLKGLFLGLAIERVVGIEQRANPELTRMCENYVVERENAGRAVPVDVWLAIGPFASDRGRQQMLSYLNHEETGHRYYAALALSQRLSQEPSLAAILRERLQSETVSIISKLLQESLQAASN